MALGVKAKPKMTNGDTAAVLLSGSPSTASGTEASKQIQFGSPGPIKPTAVQNASKRKLNVKLPANF